MGHVAAAVAVALGLGGCRQILGYEAAELEACTPGATQPCDSGGTETCKDDGTGWGACVIPPGSVAWSRLSPLGSKSVLGLGVDGEGNIFVGGDFGLAKLAPDGTTMWTNSMDTGVGQLVVDSSGRVTGAFGTSVAQYDSTGTLLWTRTYDATNSPQLVVTALAIDPTSGNVIVAGAFNGSADFGGGTLSTLGMSDLDVFVTELRSGTSAMNGGGTVWATQLGGTAAGYRSPTGVAAGANGVVVLVGQLVGDFSTASGDLMSMATAASSNHDGFYVYFDPTSDLHSFSGKTFGDGSDQMPSSIAVDPMGKVVFTGYISGTVSFGDSPLMTGGPTDVNTFLAKYSVGEILYSKAWGGDRSEGFSIATDADSNIVLLGLMTGTMSFGGMELSNLGQDALYLVKLNPAGSHIWSEAFSDTTTAIKQPILTAIDPTTQQVIVGFGLEGSIDLGTGTLAPAANETGASVLAKLNP